jgi:hypothetical protein
VDDSAHPRTKQLILLCLWIYADVRRRRVTGLSRRKHGFDSRRARQIPPSAAVYDAGAARTTPEWCRPRTFAVREFGSPRRRQLRGQSRSSHHCDPLRACLANVMLTRSTEGRLQVLRRLCSLFADPTQQSDKQKIIPDGAGCRTAPAGRPARADEVTSGSREPNRPAAELNAVKPRAPTLAG